LQYISIYCHFDRSEEQPALSEAERVRSK